MEPYTMEEACAVLNESVAIVGELPGRPEARACVAAVHELRTNRLTWEGMQAVIDAARAAAGGGLNPAWATQARIAIALAQYELDFQKAFFEGAQAIEEAWHQDQIAALDALNGEYAYGGLRFEVMLGVAA